MSISKSFSLIMQEYKDKIILDENIEKQPNGNRGVYGLFIIENGLEKCAYIGRSEIVSSRITDHLYKIIDGNHASKQLNSAFLDKESRILCKFVEPVEYCFDNYYMDAQRLASRECHWIDEYQKKGECLEQVPEGRRPDMNWWNRQAEKRNCKK